MKKFIIGIFVGLIALFGTIASVGFKSSFNDFNDYKIVKNAIVETNTNEYTFYLDNSINYYSQTLFNYNVAVINENSKLYYITEASIIDASYSLNLLIQFGNTNIEFSSTPLFDHNNNQIAFGNSFSELIGQQSIAYDFETLIISPNTWFAFRYVSGSDVPEVYKILGFKLTNLTSIQPINDINNNLSPYIGNLTSLPSEEPEEPTPPPDIGSMESSIGNVIRGIIEWFVDIFNGLADAFVITDASGQFVGFTVWGQVLFIEVGIGLVILVLKWVISLIRGV